MTYATVKQSILFIVHTGFHQANLALPVLPLELFIIIVIVVDAQLLHAIGRQFAPARIMAQPHASLHLGAGEVERQRLAINDVEDRRWREDKRLANFELPDDLEELPSHLFIDAGFRAGTTQMSSQGAEPVRGCETVD